MRFNHDGQGFIGAVEQYFTIDKKSTVLNRRNTYFEDMYDEIINNPHTIRVAFSLFVLAIAILVLWSV